MDKINPSNVHPTCIIIHNKMDINPSTMDLYTSRWMNIHYFSSQGHLANLLLFFIVI